MNVLFPVEDLNKCGINFNFPHLVFGSLVVVGATKPKLLNLNPSASPLRLHSTVNLLLLLGFLLLYENNTQISSCEEEEAAGFCPPPKN